MSIEQLSKPFTVAGEQVPQTAIQAAIEVMKGDVYTYGQVCRALYQNGFAPITMNAPVIA